MINSRNSALSDTKTKKAKLTRQKRKIPATKEAVKYKRKNKLKRKQTNLLNGLLKQT
jgi:hypothetical protein